MQELQDVLSGGGTDHAVDLLAVPEEYEGGDSLYTELHGEVGVLIRVDFHHLDPTRVAHGNIIQYGPHHPAGAAPRRPEVQCSGNCFREYFREDSLPSMLIVPSGILSMFPHLPQRGSEEIFSSFTLFFVSQLRQRSIASLFILKL